MHRAPKWPDQSFLDFLGKNYNKALKLFKNVSSSVVGIFTGVKRSQKAKLKNKAYWILDQQRTPNSDIAETSFVCFSFFA